jgi:hypothetical protein
MAMNFLDAFAFTESSPVIDPGSLDVPSTESFAFSEQTPTVGLASADGFAFAEAVVSGPGDSDSGTLVEAISLSVQMTDADALALGETTGAGADQRDTDQFLFQDTGPPSGYDAFSFTETTALIAAVASTDSFVFADGLLSLGTGVTKGIGVTGSVGTRLALGASVGTGLTLGASSRGAQTLTGSVATALALAGSMATAVSLKGSINVATNANIGFYKGEDVVLTVTMSPATNITGLSLTFTMRKQFNDVSILTKATGGSGITITDAVNGVFTITIASADTAGLDNRAYAFDIQRTNAGNRTVLTIGNLTLLPEVTL